MFLATYDTGKSRHEPDHDANPRSIVIGAWDEERDVITRQVEDLTEIVATTPDPTEGLKFARSNDLAFVILYLDHSPDVAMAVAHELAKNTSRPIVMVSRDHNPDLIVQAMRAGVRDFAYLEQEGDIRRAVTSLDLTQADSVVEPGQVIAVFGAKGGSGATTVATNLARALSTADHDKRFTVLVDLDMQMGDVMVFLDIANGFGWRELVEETDRLDDELLDQLLMRHDSGLRVVAQSTPLDEIKPIDAAAIVRSLKQLRGHAGHVVIDGLRDFDDNALAALDLADRILLTFTQDVPALKNASRCLAIFRRLGYDDDKVKLVVNRYQRRGKIGLDAIADALRAPITATIANDFPTVISAINSGRLLLDSAPRARVTRDIMELAVTLDPAATPPKRGFFRRGVWS